MKAPSGERFTIYCAKAAAEEETAFRFKGDDNFAAFYWVDDKIAYVVSGPADRERLEKVTKSAYEQIEKSAAQRSRNGYYRSSPRSRTQGDNYRQHV